ncbi:hypothetical protein [Mucilaginibacter sp. SP1R1]|uniref:hypothetical protein n=1 Tax=Mucilaginibacter sp. SP1R1 TaxID=2723091 RepID=UPI00161E4CC8|nr:hypothetical protein [Mucilaginibacter sp. SP1R1]MBB6150148.1 hypothetical protein [Mucilaginibacter sp. SP1R1]
MKHIILLLFLILIFNFDARAQEIKAKDAHQYVGKTVTVVGKIKYIVGPGYLTSMSFLLVTDSSEVGVAITVLMKIWSKSKVLNEKQGGKTMKAKGLIEQITKQDTTKNSLPYIVIKNLSDVHILQ